MVVKHHASQEACLGIQLAHERLPTFCQVALAVFNCIETRQVPECSGIDVFKKEPGSPGFHLRLIRLTAALCTVAEWIEDFIFLSLVSGWDVMGKPANSELRSIRIWSLG